MVTESAGIRLIVGLGNPGEQYEATRHNVGFWLVDRIAADFRETFRAESKFFGQLARIRVGGLDVRLLKPSTYMNRSGQSIAAVSRYYSIPPEQILVAHDELDHPVGQVRLKQGGGHAGHNGLRDTMTALGGSRDFWRLRIGIAHPGDRTLVTGYVLGRPSRDDAEQIGAALADVERILDDLVGGRFQLAMNRLHSQRRD
jgi:peptidyl-tRNA hydrolase, PTH1 family